LHRLICEIKEQINIGNETDDKSKGSYVRLNTFIWNRSHVKKVIMTIPYNSLQYSMKDYLMAELVQLPFDEVEKCYWYSDSTCSVAKINNNDLILMVGMISKIVKHDFKKIEKLVTDLNNVAKLFNMLNLPIYWSLPSGLNIYQSSEQGKSITISPFTYSKIKINLKVSSKDIFDHKKQTRALMPNLIHSLDAHSMTHL
jgi:DNA-directed RNA polymerase